MYSQSMFQRKNKKNRYTPAYPSFAIQKWGSGGVYITQTCFCDVCNTDIYCVVKHQLFKTPPTSHAPRILFYLFIYFLNSVLRPFQNYFSSYYTGQSVGEANTGNFNPGKNLLVHPQAELDLSHCGAQTHTRHSSDMIE